MKNVGIALGFAMALGCSPQRETWEVAAHRAPCVGEAAQLCLLVKRPTDSQSHLYYDGIVGLAPKWGHEYTVDVEITDVSNPPADGSSERVTLTTTRRDTPVPVGTTFEFDVFTGMGAGYLSLTATDAGQLVDGTRFTCAPGSDVCDQIAARLADGAPFAITFAHGADSLTALSAEASTFRVLPDVFDFFDHSRAK